MFTSWGLDCADAHSGRRFEIEVVAGKLQAQGINTGDSDGAPAVRPYVNVIHDHWRNVESLGSAVASLPGFDVPHHVTPLINHSLLLDLISVRKWANPPTMPADNTIPRIQPLDSGELITIHGPFITTTSNQLGELLLSADIPVGGATDLDLVYEINRIPQNEIHLLQFVLSAAPSDGSLTTIHPSDPIHVLLSPDGLTLAEKLHHASLFLESNIHRVVFVPEPSTVWLVLTLSVTFCACWRRRSTSRTH